MNTSKKLTAIFLCLIGLFMTTSVFAKTVLHGTIKDKFYYNSYNGDSARKSFPQKYYKYYLYANDLKYDANTDKKDYFDYPLYDVKVTIKADLDLVSVDKNTDIYRFKLSLQPIGVTFTGWTAIKNFGRGGFGFDGTIILTNGLPAVFDLDVKLIKNQRDKYELINLNKNPYFELAFYGLDFNTKINMISDIPVIITTP